jgi:predicted transcriptional regulator
MQKDIGSKRKKQDKDKYIKVRQNFLNYIIANENAITVELNKKYK